MNKGIKAAILSALVWGSGQILVGRQRIKGLMIFLIQALCVGIELYTGYWIEYLMGKVPHFNLKIYGGYFTKALWGFVTLGETPGARNGDHSIVLLINGIIAILLLVHILAFYIWNIIDAYHTGKRIDETGRYISSKEYLQHVTSKFFPYLILAPIIIGILFIVVMPILFSFITAFTNYNKNHLPPANLVDWVGISNFVKLFKVPVWSSTFFSILGWNIIWAVVATFSTYFLGMFQAIIINSKYAKFKSFFRAILILPWAIPQLITLLVFKNLLNGQFGPVAQMLIDIGLTDYKIPFLSDPFIAKITIIMVNLWLGFPMFMVMIQGVLANIDTGLYEAARIDGANSLQIFRGITFPLVFKATAPLFIMNLASNFNGFGIIYFLTEGKPVNPNYHLAGDTDILISWIYKLTLNERMYDMAAVMCIILFIVVGVASFYNFKHTQSFKEV